MTFHAARGAATAQQGKRLIAGAMPPLLAATIDPAELASMHERLKRLPEPPTHAILRKDDWLGALGIFLLVFLSTFPVVLPFVFMQSATPALRVSNGIAIAMLFVTGYAFGRMT